MMLASTQSTSFGYLACHLPIHAVANWLPAGESDVYGEPQEFFGGEPVFRKVLEFAAKVPSNNTGVYYYEGRDAVSAAVTKILGGTDVETALQEAQDNVEFAMQ